jgi:hypothetical protein
MTGYSKKLEASENASQSYRQWRVEFIDKAYEFELTKKTSPTLRSDEEKL